MLPRPVKRTYFLLPLCIFLAIIVKGIIILNHSFVDSDKALQVAAAKAFNEGQGISAPVVLASDFSKIIYEPVTHWPPLYSLLVSILLKITGNQYELSCLIIDMLAGLLSILLLFLILRKLQFPDWLTGLMILWESCAITEDILRSSPTDSLACDALLATLYVAIVFYKRPSALLFLPLIFLNLIPGLLKYLYVPAMFVVPSVFIRNGAIKKNRKILRSGIYLFIISLASIAILFLYNKAQTGGYTASPVVLRGFYPENLLYIYPIFWESFFGVNFAGTQLSIRTDIEFSVFYQIMSFTGTVLLFFLFVAIFKKYLFQKFGLNDSEQDCFFLTGGLLSLSISLTLIYLSLTTNAYLPPPVDRLWTYVSQPRYFLFVQYIVFICLNWWVFVNLKPSLRKNVFALVLIGFSIVQISHGIYFSINNFKNVSSSSINAAGWRKITTYIDNVAEECRRSGREIILVSPDYGYIGYAGMKNIKILSQMESLEKTTHFGSEKILLLLIKQTNSVKGVESFILKNHLEEATRIDGTSFYHFTFDP